MKAEYIDHMGTDLSVVNAARVSFDNYHEDLTEGDSKLINFLAKHQHVLPFAHTAITLRMTAPIPIRTQCFKHKIGFVENEISRRYVSTEPEVFKPTWREAVANKKQGSGDTLVELLPDIESLYMESIELATYTYEGLLTLGVCPEQARFVLPQGMLTSWVWTGSLLAFTRFYNLRAKPDAQKEVQELAGMVGEIIAPLFPLSWEALV